MGLREDKNPKDISIENSKQMAKIVNKKAVKKSPSKKAPSTPVKKKANTLTKNNTQAIKGIKPATVFDVAKGVDQLITINKQQLKFTNLNKVYWKKEGINKGDMLNYYAQIAPYILPYMKDRPQSLHRHPDGVNGMHFFQKDMRGKVPGWIATHESFSESNNETIEYRL